MTEQERWDSYFWPGTQVLRNKPGVKSEVWPLLEAEFVGVREAELPLWGFDGDTLEQELRAIHRWLFQDCYDWAGELRTVNMKKSHPLLEAVPSFLPWDQISANLEKVQVQIDALPPGGASQPALVEKLGEIHGMLNAVHPFREGNGRATRAYMNQLAGQYDISLDWEGMTPSLHFASAVSLVHEEKIDLEPWKAFYAEIARSSPWGLDATVSVEDGDDLAGRKAIVDSLIAALYAVPDGAEEADGSVVPTTDVHQGHDLAMENSLSHGPELE